MNTVAYSNHFVMLVICTAFVPADEQLTSSLPSSTDLKSNQKSMSILSLAYLLIADGTSRPRAHS